MNHLPRLGAAILVLLVVVAASWGQQNVNQPTGPNPPLYQGESTSKPHEPSEEIKVPDSRPLTGAQEITLGSSEASLNYLQASFRFSETADSNSALSSGRPGYQAVSGLSGSLELHRNSEHQDLMLRYTGGGVFYSDTSAFNNSFHLFDISQTVKWQRWSLLVADNLSYSPESRFNGGYGGISGLGNLGAWRAPTSLSPLFNPEQSMLTVNTPQVINTALGQVQYNLSPRSSVTATGSYGVVRFLDADLLNVNQLSVGAGYNHALNAKDTVAISYGYGQFRYQGQGQEFVTHSAELNYGRRVTGRLSWQVSAGPQVLLLSEPGSETTQVYWTGRTSLLYRRARTDFSLAFTHSVTAGSGVLLGAKTNQVEAGATRQLSRNWSTSTNFGYARNTGLATVGSFDSIYGGVQVQRAIGRTASVYVSYMVQHQTSSTVCSALACGPDVLRHVFGVGFDWHMRPIRLH